MRLLLIFTATALIGIALVIYSSTMPVYTDLQKADQLLANSHGLSSEEYYKAEAELRTAKMTLLDLGSGMAIGAGMILVFLLVHSIRTSGDVREVMTMNRVMIFLFANLAWLLHIWGIEWYFEFRLERGDYPWFADSIGIPIMMLSWISLVLIIPLNVFLIFALYRSSLPAKLFVLHNQLKGPLLFIELFFGFLLVINIAFNIIFILGGDHISIIVGFCFTYVLLALRAGQVSRFIAESGINR